MIYLACALLLIVLLLLFRVKLCAGYDGEFHLSLRYLFVRYRFRNFENGKDKSSRNKAPKKQKKRSIRPFLENFGVYFRFVKNTAGDLLKIVRVDRLELNVVVAEEDAAQTAIVYGEACALIYPATAFLAGLKGSGQQHVSVRPDFTAEEGSVSFGCVLSARLGSLAGVALKRLFLLFFSLIQTALQNNFAPNRQKGSVSK